MEAQAACSSPVPALLGGVRVGVCFAAVGLTGLGIGLLVHLPPALPLPLPKEPRTHARAL